MKNANKVFLVALLFLLPFLSLPAHAAVGDFLYKWGGEHFTNQEGIAVDPTNGNVYVADSGNSRVQVFSSEGIFLNNLGTVGTDDGHFDRPMGVAVDSTGNVYVTDTSSRVQVFSNTGAFIRKWGTMGSGNDQLYWPISIAVDSTNGNVYVADYSNNRVQVFSNTGLFIRSLGNAGSGDGQFINPRGIVVDSNGNVYVADAGNARVQVFSNTGTFLRKWGTFGIGDGQFGLLRHIALDSSGNVYVTDDGIYGNAGRVQVFSNAGTFLRKWGTTGTGDGQFKGITGIAVNASGSVYVNDFGNTRVQVFSTEGAFLRKWGVAPSDAGQFEFPEGIAVASSGEVYVADTNNNRVQVFDNTGAFLRTWGTKGAGEGQFNIPMGIAVDSIGGIVYVADYQNHRVQVFSTIGVFLRNLGTQGPGGDGSQFIGPTSVAVDSNGNVFVADYYNQRVWIFNSAGTLLRSWYTGVYGGSYGLPNGIAADSSGNVYVVAVMQNQVLVFSNEGVLLGTWGSYGSGDGQFYYPTGVAVDAGGNVYVADTYNHRVQIFSNTGTFLTKWGTNGGEDGQFWSPMGIAVDLSGKVLVADTYNKRVQAFEGDAQAPVTTSMISGMPGANGWYVSNVAASLSASDSGSGVKEIHYSIDGTETIVAGSTASFTISTEGTHTVSYYAKDNAGNSEAAHSLAINIDKTPPTIAITGVANGATYILGGVPTAGNTVTDNTSGVATHSATLTGGYANGTGTYIYTVTSTDYAGNAATVSATYSVVYGFSGFLEPIILGKPFKLGSTIPVKFRLTDAQGNYVSTAVATITVQQFSGDDPIGDPLILSANGADSGNVFRYDAADNLYIFNFGTKDMLQGTWQIRATLDDGTVKSAFVQLKKN